MIREHQLLHNNHRICCNMRLDGDLIEEITGTDVSQMYDIPNLRDGYGVVFEVVFVADPTDPTRQCLKRGTSTRMKGCYSPSFMPNILELNDNDPTLYKRYFNYTTPDYARCNLIGKTLEFCYYPANVNNGYRLILSNVDKYASPATNTKGIDFVQNGASFRMFTYSSNGSGTERTLATGIVATKWYRFKIEHIDIGNEEFYYRVSVFDNDTLIGYMDENTMGTFYYGSRNPNNRVPCFLNSHWGYYARQANTYALLKDVLIYEN